MLRAYFLFTLGLFTASGWAQPAFFKSFFESKVLLKKSVLQKGTPLLAIVDNKCLYNLVPGKGRGLGAHLVLDQAAIPDMSFEARRIVLLEPSTSNDIEAALQANPCVIGIADNPTIQTAGLATDPLVSLQAHRSAIAQSDGDKYFLHPIWGLRKPVVAAVIDSGIQLDHPDLSPRLWHGADGSSGYDFVHGDSQAMDDFGHGTHVAGLIGAQGNNGIGGRGVMGDWVQLMAVKTQDSDGGGTVADVINGILWAADHGAEVMNLSLTTTASNPALEEALVYALNKNAVITVASGNEGLEISLNHFVSPIAYARDHAGLIGVGAIDAGSLLRSNFSNFGPSFVEIAAPGAIGSEGLLSTFPSSSYRKLAGTSMASPQVAGAAALVISFCKTRAVAFKNAQIEEWIEQSAAQSEALTSSFALGRRLDLERLGRLMFNTQIVDATGGFDDP